MRNYVVEADFKYQGLRCVVVMTEMGHRCGYVGISNTHPLYGKDYSDTIGKFFNIKENSMKKISPINIMMLAFEQPNDNSPVRIDCYFNVHGGITYAGQGDYPVKSDLWWFGYDCAHAGDAKDIDAIKDERLKEMEKEFKHYGEVRTLKYCINECKSLAEQLVQITE